MLFDLKRFKNQLECHSKNVKSEFAWLFKEFS